MRLHEWPEKERPREKLLRRGAGALSDSELLAIFLRTGIAGKNVVDLSRELLQHFGGIGPLLAANEDKFCEVKGLGRAKYAQLQAVLELCRRYLEEEIAQQPLLDSSQNTQRYLQSRLSHLPHEVFVCLLLDSRHQLIEYHELFRGSLNSASVHPREVAKLALQLNAAAIIIAHNHPSGDPTPSEADRYLTRELAAALALIEVKLLDHIVIGKGQCCSLAEMNLL